MRNLEEVLKDLVADSRSKCNECSYYDYDDCGKELVNDLLASAEELIEENKKLKERNKCLSKLINETVNLCSDLISQIDQMDQSK